MYSVINFAILDSFLSIIIYLCFQEGNQDKGPGIYSTDILISPVTVTLLSDVRIGTTGNFLEVKKFSVYLYAGRTK
jgi:hypothetical protein